MRISIFPILLFCVCFCPRLRFAWTVSLFVTHFCVFDCMRAKTYIPRQLPTACLLIFLPLPISLFLFGIILLMCRFAHQQVQNVSLQPSVANREKSKKRKPPFLQLYFRSIRSIVFEFVQLKMHVYFNHSIYNNMENSKTICNRFESRRKSTYNKPKYNAFIYF